MIAPHADGTTLRRAQLALQWGLLLLVAASLLTRLWFDHEWLAWPLAVATIVAWWPDLRSGTRRWWFFYIVGTLVYTLLRSVANDAFSPTRFEYVINIDRFLFAGTDPVVWLQSRLFSLGSVGFFDVLATQIHWSYFVIPHAIAIGVYIWRRHLFTPFILRLLGVQYAGLILFFLVPTAPPWLAARTGDLDPVYRVMHFVGRTVDPSTYDALYLAVGEPNSVAAMPSLHMAITVILYLWVRRHFPRFQWSFLAYTALMAVALVHLAEHYVADLIAGALIAAFVDRIIAARTRPQPELAPIEAEAPVLVDAR